LWWCDVISTATLLRSISFINEELLSRVYVNILLNRFGQPVSISFLFRPGIVSENALAHALFAINGLPRVKALTLSTRPSQWNRILICCY
jgi:hypothetical protein